MNALRKIARLLLLGSALAAGGVHAAAVFTPDASPTGWVAPIAVSNIDFSSGNETIYRAYFNKADWSGNLYAFPVSATGVVDIANERWGTGTGLSAHGGAAAVLDAQNWNTGRKIVTVKVASGVATKIPFRYGPAGTGFGIANNTAPTGTQIATFGTTYTGALNVLNFLRGDRSQELPAGALRARNTVLGDIVHSRPYYDNHDPANPRLYVGANDGMLHAFNATTGAEVFAYIPSMLLNRLSSLSVDTDPFAHKYYVDGSPNARTANLSSGTKTILVGSVGAGGSGTASEGLYALDISDASVPASETAAAAKIQWEITSGTRIYNGNVTTGGDYTNLGQVYGAPLIVKVNSSGTPGYTWAAIVGNGYNSGTGKTTLYVINLETGALIREIDTGATGSASAPGGLSKPAAIDTNGDGVVDTIYAGDINGTMWKFNVSSTSSGSWNASSLYVTSPAQAITGAPTVTFVSSGVYMVNFGTGRMFTTADAADATTTYAVYGLRDDATAIASTNLNPVSLTEKSFTSCPAAVNPCRVRIAVAGTPVTTPKGWKLTLSAGERVVGDGGLLNSDGRYVFTTTNPAIVHASLSDGTIIPQGENWLVEVAYDTGGPGANQFFDMTADGTVDASDLLPVSGTQSRIPVARLVNYGVISQPVLAQLTVLSKSFFNSNPDVDAPTACTGVCSGHFDFDIYYGSCTYSTKNGFDCKTNDHTHQYDDVYNVTGVNMLDPSKAAVTLTNGITSTSKQFKIIMSNQTLSPGVNFKVGTSSDPDTYIPVWQYQTPYAASPPPAIGSSTNSTFLNSLPTYTTATLQKLTFALPTNAFSVREWITGSGVQQVGLVPGDTGCVRSADNKSNTGADPWMNASLTIQFVDVTSGSAATDADIEFNMPGQPLFGYRLKKTSLGKLLNQYTMFWHSSPHVCYGDPGYDPTPAADTTTSSGTTPPGSGDPTGGITTPGNAGGSGGQIIRDTNFIDGSYVTLTVTPNAAGPANTTTSTTTANGTTTSTTPGGGAGGDEGKEHDTRIVAGRVSWSEIQRP